ncbi:dynein light chain Tctex-type 5-like [Styela clava]|uniref:tctex1 domain-containing protein 1-like isoform X2 n=1 Tax=Styela clava TaxID=7725 RepID=UPI00193A3BEA|nr:tctex1 domain-containing protein 1-like isoform X2 [Styela clava]
MNKGRKPKLEKSSKGKLLAPSDVGTMDDAITEDSRSQRAGSEISFAIMNTKKVQYENTYRTDPSARFKPYEIEGTAKATLEEHLGSKPYDPNMCKTECQVIAAKISEAIKAKNYKRYKHVVVVSIGSLKERPSVYLGSRCLWNDKTDSFTTVRYKNSSLYAIAMIYGLYYE